MCNDCGASKADVKHKPPTPGSSEAVKQGCACAVFDNHYGEGFSLYGKHCFYMSADCPIHGMKKTEPSN